jgi:hypothetical protein
MLWLNGKQKFNSVRSITRTARPASNRDDIILPFLWQAERYDDRCFAVSKDWPYSAALTLKK